MSPRRNRVTPSGEVVAVHARGTVMGNRGSLHSPDGRIVRTHRSTAWLACLLEFKGRRRQVMQPGRYTELFFLDEATSLAAGHRPCAECRRKDARRFQAADAEGLRLAGPLSLDEIDARLHAERRDRRSKRFHHATAETLPSGAVIGRDGVAFALLGRAARRWSPDGYGDLEERPTGTVDVVTPPLAVAALRAGYAPLWHWTASVC